MKTLIIALTAFFAMGTAVYAQSTTSTPKKEVGQTDAPADSVLESPKQICDGLAIALVGAIAGMILTTALVEYDVQVPSEMYALYKVV